MLNLVVFVAVQAKTHFDWGFPTHDI
ncbi:uncharacterized protein METZ01_LOCUS278781, partial [marine metagenome]